MPPGIPTVKRVLNCLPSLNPELDWLFETALATGILKPPQKIPASVDLREPWWKINDQRLTGSCVGWAAVDSVLRWHFVKANRLKEDELLSPRFIWMAAKETDKSRTRPTTFIEADGTTVKAALDIARKFGCVRESVLPFDTGALYQSSADTFYALASQLKISSYFNLGRDLDRWRTWLAMKGPILTRLVVDSTWDGAKAANGLLAAYKSETAHGGHAVALVGYTTNSFIVRNSWGTDWGNGGFGFASLEYAKKAFVEAYGVIV